MAYPHGGEGRVGKRERAGERDAWACVSGVRPCRRDAHAYGPGRVRVRSVRNLHYFRGSEHELHVPARELRLPFPSTVASREACGFAVVWDHGTLISITGNT